MLQGLNLHVRDQQNAFCQQQLGQLTSNTGWLRTNNSLKYRPPRGMQVRKPMSRTALVMLSLWDDRSLSKAAVLGRA